MTKAPETLAELAYAWGQLESQGTNRAPLHGERKAREFIDNEIQRASTAGRTISAEQVNAAAKVIYDASTGLVDDAWEREDEVEQAYWLGLARDVLEACGMAIRGDDRADLEEAQ